MRVGIYGGSFDPVHVGHLMVASWLRWTDQVDEVWLVVAHDHPFGKEAAPFASRVAWCRAAVAELPGVRVSDVEATLPRPNYSIDTLEALSRAHPGHRFRFVLGSDAHATVDRWHRWPDVQAGFDPIVVQRSGHRTGEGDGPVFPEVSSTDVRERARQGRPIGQLVPRSVLDLVLQHYGPPPGAREPGA